MLNKFLTIVGITLAVMLFAIVVFVLNGAVLMLLWNWIMPALFGLPEISLLMSIGICFLFGCITGGIKVKLSQ
jgi:hypothetical protein